MMDALPTACLDHIARDLVAMSSVSVSAAVHSSPPPETSLRDGARLGAALAMVGHPAFSRMADVVYDLTVDPGCASAKERALRDYDAFVKRRDQAVCELEEDILDFVRRYDEQETEEARCGRPTSRSKAASLRRLARELAIRWIVLDRVKAGGHWNGTNDDEALIIKHRCAVRPAAREVARAAVLGRELDVEQVWRRYGVALPTNITSTVREWAVVRYVTEATKAARDRTDARARAHWPDYSSFDVWIGSRDVARGLARQITKKRR